MSEKASQKKSRSLEEMIGALSAQFDSMSKQLSLNNEQLYAANKRLDEQAERFVKLENMLSSVLRENADLKQQLENKDSEIIELKSRINAVEQHSRSSCIRIFKMSIDGDDNDPAVVAEQVYNTIFLPIFRGAVDMKRLRYVPPIEQCIVTAHVLPSKDNKTKPILVRLINAHFRTIIMQLKKDYAPRAPAAPAPASDSASVPVDSSKPPPQAYAIYEDMTKDAFQLMRALSSHVRVNSCWCTGGQLRFRLVDSATIQKVRSIYDPIEKILNM